MISLASNAVCQCAIRAEIARLQGFGERFADTIAALTKDLVALREQMQKAQDAAA